MALTMDPETAAALVALFADQPDAPLPAVGDVATRRAGSEVFYPLLFAGVPQATGVTRTDHRLTTSDGAEILPRWYAPPGEPTGAAGLLYIHGGGMSLGSVEHARRRLTGARADSGVAWSSVDYRLAPEHPYPAPVEDCYAALRWIAAQRAPSSASTRPASRSSGDSAGGGLAAARRAAGPRPRRARRSPSDPASTRCSTTAPYTPDPTASTADRSGPRDNVTGWPAPARRAAGRRRRVRRTPHRPGRRPVRAAADLHRRRRARPLPRRGHRVRPPGRARACRSSCTCTRACRTRSRCSRRTRPSHGVRRPTGSGYCGRSRPGSSPARRWTHRRPTRSRSGGHCALPHATRRR